jgi:translation initiation factor 2 gamma subunit (eIF-2gamma)
MIKNFITTQNKVEIVEQARILNYSFDKEFVFTTKDKLTYFDYSRVLNEYS